MFLIFFIEKSISVLHFNRVNREDQFFRYALTIHRITFEDEASLNITARAFDLFNTTVIRPKITGKTKQIYVYS